jgi:hypothetical protein
VLPLSTDIMTFMCLIYSTNFKVWGDEIPNKAWREIKGLSQGVYAMNYSGGGNVIFDRYRSSMSSSEISLGVSRWDISMKKSYVPCIYAL